MPLPVMCAVTCLCRAVSPRPTSSVEIDHDIIVYKHIGYDEKFAQSSPGTVLLYLMLQRLLNEGEFRLLDFDGTEYYPYKEFFSTRAISCARLFWFQAKIPRDRAFWSTLGTDGHMAVGSAAPSSHLAREARMSNAHPYLRRTRR